MSIGAQSDIRIRSVSSAGVRAKLAGTPLEGYADLFVALATKYAIDPNWALAYLQWESGFGRESPAPTNPWDILCATGNWRQIDCVTTGAGYSYAVYPDMATGLEAGFRLWDSYYRRGWTNWFSSLSVALCGNPQGCQGTWVESVISQGQANAEAYPYVESPIPPPVNVEIFNSAAVLLGALMLLAGSAYLYTKAQGG